MVFQSTTTAATLDKAAHMFDVMEHTVEKRRMFCPTAKNEPTSKNNRNQKMFTTTITRALA